MKNTSIKSCYSTLESCFKDMLSEATDLVEKEFESISEKNEWVDKQWQNYGDDITEYLKGLVSPENTEESKLIENVSLQDMTAAIKANSEGIFGFDISSYLEN